MLSLLLAIVIAFSILPVTQAYAASLPFTDVPTGIWYYKDLVKTYDTGLFKGMSATTFGPDGNLTLAQAVTLASRVSQYVNDGKVTLKNGKPVWYTTYVDYAKSHGIIGNEYDGRWNDPATRYEMVEIFAAIPGIDTTPINRVDDNAIPDVKTNDPHAPAVYTFYRAGILTGYTGGNHFDGSSNIRRCEVAAILSRLLYTEKRKHVTLVKTIPEKSDPLNYDTLMALLDAYDPDGAWIIEHAENSGTSWKDWVYNGNTVADLEGELGTVVHEQLHGYTGMAGWRSEYIYIGDGKSIEVTYTDVYDTAEVADTFPAELQTFRYDTYVSSDAEYNMASRQQGIYGLMNEFAAYCWGMNNDIKMEAYFGSSQYGFTNTYVAFAEFHYYILSYMIYAKENYPAVYNGIMANDNLRKSFKIIDNKFQQLAEQYRSARPFITGSSFDKEYQALMNASSTAKYTEMLKLLKS